MSIRNTRFLARFKRHLDWIVVIVVFLVIVISSFIFGYVLGKETDRAPIIIEECID